MKANCQVCQTEFYAKPYFVRLGQAKFCSRKCSAIDQKRGKAVKCSTCEKEIWRTPKDFDRSKSKLFFCNKTCQTIWRNSYFSGENHANWNGGESSYREVMKRTGNPKVCADCGNKDERVIVVHHKDRNRKNNKPDNLKWLCRNCHCLEHLK